MMVVVCLLLYFTFQSMIFSLVYVSRLSGGSMERKTIGSKCTCEEEGLISLKPCVLMSARSLRTAG